MKTRNSLALLLAVLTLIACGYDDSKLWEQIKRNTERIAAIEAWQAEINTNIQALQTLLSTTDYITAVTSIVEAGVEVGYTISFLNSPAITVYHGKKGDKGEQGEDGAIPHIGLVQSENGSWYWTLNGTTLIDDQGNPIRASGETGEIGTSSPVPQLATGTILSTQGVTTDIQGAALVPDAIYLSVNDGQTWARVSGKKGEQGLQGDNLFSDIDYESEPNKVTFTLNDGTTFSIPRYMGISLTFETETLPLVYGASKDIAVTAEGNESFTLKNLYAVAPYGWKASISLTRTVSAAFTLTVTAPAYPAGGATEGEILVVLDNGQGNTTIGRLKVTATLDNNMLKEDNLQPGELAAAIGNRTGLTSITVTSGNINETDWAAIMENKTALLYLDLEGVTYTGTDGNSLVYNGNYYSYPLIVAKLPQGITGLGTKAFSYCSNLSYITLPNSVTSIGADAFNNCYNLVSITLPDGVTSIGSNAFKQCGRLISITLPNEVTSIKDGAFAYCSQLISIKIPDRVTSIGGHTFQHCRNLTSITIPNGVTNINEYTFANCTALTTIDFLGEITNIGEHAFANCTALTSIDIPNSVTSIGASAFSNCSVLASITIPCKVTDIGTDAFSDCSALSTIICQAEVPPTLTVDIFYDCAALTSIQVPPASVEAYKAAKYWIEYADLITAIP